MTVSRCATEYLERKGLTDARIPPRPRLAVDDLLVHKVPIQAPLPSQGVLIAYEGENPVDRGASRPWPDQVPPPEE